MEATALRHALGKPGNSAILPIITFLQISTFRRLKYFFIGKPDPHISPIGARGIGEIGITGVAAAVANAVFNATGKRLRDLPLTPDKLI